MRGGRFLCQELVPCHCHHEEGALWVWSVWLWGPRGCWPCRLVTLSDTVGTSWCDDTNTVSLFPPS